MTLCGLHITSGLDVINVGKLVIFYLRFFFVFRLLALTWV